MVSFVLLTGCGVTQSPSATVGPAGPAGAPGLIFLNAYTATLQYVPTDVVTYQGSSYVALATSTGVAPVGATASATDWAVLAQAGATGAPGAVGAVGAAGPQGIPGLSGAQGPAGSPGTAGAQGAVGVAGAQGVQGPVGPIGLTLQSSYLPNQQYAARDVVLYQGSSYVALAANMGVAPLGAAMSGVNWAVLAQAGATGATGLQGPAGLTGAMGPQGPQGAAGPQGMMGLPGATGAMGPQGLMGLQGSTGAMGAIGQQGTPGVAGAQGTQGPAGAAGAQGSQGVAGSQGPTGATGATGPAGPSGTSAVSYLQNRKLGVQGDSFSALFNNAWQNVVTSRTGMTLAVQEAHPGKRFDTAFECWSNPAVGGMLGPFTASHNLSGTGGTCAQATFGISDGTLFADSLANVDLEVIELGTNDQSTTLGQLGDATNSGTYYGNMRWVVENYLNAKPTLRVVMVTLQFNNFASAATNQQYADATVAYGNSIGIPVINMFKLGGVNAISSPVLLRDGAHPSDFAFANFYGPVIAQQLQTLF
ncbi:hypothetical protein [Granulicella tundricola]|uniref:hypothetical protein n=1 Tax=Granulicella tundricola TaxID=940615 RepID=UPI0018DB2807|nr:hypothetical protein [Granulicella tundricola]